MKKRIVPALVLSLFATFGGLPASAAPHDMFNPTTQTTLVSTEIVNNQFLLFHWLNQGP